MIIRPFLPLLLGAFLVPASMTSAHATPFTATSNSTHSASKQNNLNLHSTAFVVANPRTGEVLSERNGNKVMPIASITKLMTALVVLDAKQPLSDMLTITTADIDKLKGTGSRLGIGAKLSRADMLHIALMSSENRAASALARNYPGGLRAFVEAMNAKARMLGMWSTHYADSTGLNPRNVSSPHDLAKLVAAASTYPLIRQYSSSEQRTVRNGKHQLHYRNSNQLVREGVWPVTLSKTGYIREAGRCLVMETKVNREPVIMVLLNANTPNARLADAKRIRAWLESSGRMNANLTAQSGTQSKFLTPP